VVTFIHPGKAFQKGLDENKVFYIPAVNATERKMRERGTRAYDVFLTVVSPPDKNGFCCFGSNLWFKRTMATAAKKIIAEVDSTIKRYYGSDNFIHVSEIDGFVEYCPPDILPEEFERRVVALDANRQVLLRDIYKTLPPYLAAEHIDILLKAVNDPRWFKQYCSAMGFGEPDEMVKAMIEHVKPFVKDGSTIEIGFGPITGRLAQLGLFDDKGDLGIHSEMAARGIGKLIEKGVINGSRKTLNPNKAVFTSIEGFSADELEWAEENPLIELRNADYVININTIASHDNMLAMNTALSIDLTGQIACESIFGGRLVAGVGGQPEFHIGAFLSRGGRAITFLFSTAQNGAVSRIVPQFDEGAIVDVPRYCTDTVITEYGAVELIGKTRRERAEALISIAHPKFRGELRKAADKMSGW
jgi:4-hydroxybutyrate CoA-transferase